jgi:DNA replication and repair protein RecF
VALSIERLKIERFRNLDRAEIRPGPGVNLLLGANAAGKSSLLESLFLLGRPKSFRGGVSRDWLQKGAKAFSIFAQCRSGSRERHIGVGWDGEGVKRRLDGAVANTAELARLVPVTVFEPGMHGWLEDSPDYRRALWDWYMFHVEPNFLGTWQRYRRILQQRNAALRTRGSLAENWDESFIAHSLLLDQMRQERILRFSPVFDCLLKNLSGELENIELNFRPGGELTEEALRKKLAEQSIRERELGSTQTGAHRFDWRFSDGVGLVKRRVSRGQQKLLLLAFVLSQAKCIKMASGLEPVFLLDDFASELDGDHQSRALSLIESMGSQVFVTALSEESVPDEIKARSVMFHVEHGDVRSIPSQTS